ncbi:MAG TPA: hypothetical protein VGS96_00065 [Thermoanaerobaculia bacterium]|nr:hypothetical protein [Thermoanaerobaculia bacterium]
MRSRELLVASGALVAVLWFSIPATPWEFDELLFVQSLGHYDPISHHPPPPGYPLFIAAGDFFRLFAPNNFTALVAMNFLASAIGFVLLALAFRRISGDLRTGVAGALLFYFSPVMLVHSTLAMSDPGAVALLAATLYFADQALLFGTFAALTIGWRPQFAIFVLPLLFLQLAMTREWPRRAIALAAFTVVCVLWLIPLTRAVGGLDRLIHFESSQAGYLAAHDAAVSRSGWSTPQLALRFSAHPWGTKIASLPLLIVAGVGVVAAIRKRELRVIPLAIAALLYLGFALRFLDPADGVRYAIPFVLGTAFFAGTGLIELTRRFNLPTYAFVALFAAGSIVFVSSLVSQRRATESPPLRAARLGRWLYPQNAVVLYELPLWPHAQVFFADRQRLRVNDGLAKYFDRPDVPLFIYADGISHAPGSRTVRWLPSDAYSKLTRNHYRVVSLIPVPPESRFLILRGVYLTEREVEGEEWRWLDSPAELQLPHGPARMVAMRLGLPTIYPMAVNPLTIFVDGVKERTLELQRGKPIDVVLSVPAGSPVLRFEAGRAFVPAEVPGSLNRDPRHLAVKLYDLRSTL